MQIEILSSESLGVRGLCCFVSVPGRKILIDPGIALGYMRHKLLPHPFQIAVGERIKKHILICWEQATDIVFSHFHGDHVPLADANPYQLHIKDVIDLNPKVRIWSKPEEFLSRLEKKRATDINSFLDVDFLFDECGEKEVAFAGPFFHGDVDNPDTVIMTRIAADRVFVHASDIQLLSMEPVSRILDWSPDVALVDGPPLYLNRLSPEQVNTAWENALRLARNVDALILDHHLMRDRRGVEWLSELSHICGKQVMCSADFMHRPRMFLEAEREKLYADMPVSEHWHEDYENNGSSLDAYWDMARKYYKNYQLERYFRAQ
ncbi:MAG: MBL fold metallo-hydrolase [Thermodesulfobacteriota bacterium]